MRRVLSFVLVSLVAARPAQAGGPAIYLGEATSKLALSVANVSGSPALEDRLFQVTTPPLVVHAEGTFGCPAGSVADSVQLVFGHVVVQGDQIFPFAWASSAPVDLGGVPFGAFAVDHALDLQASWDPGDDLFDLGYNGAHTVHMAYVFAEQGNADMVHWMQSDQAFEDSLTLNVVLRCDDGVQLLPGVDTASVDVSILYHGDRSIQYPTVAGTPGDVDAGTSSPPGYDGSTTGGSDPTTGDGTKDTDAR